MSSCFLGLWGIITFTYLFNYLSITCPTLTTSNYVLGLIWNNGYFLSWCRFTRTQTLRGSCAPKSTDPHSRSMRLHYNLYSRRPSWCWSCCHSCLHCSCWVTILTRSRMAGNHASAWPARSHGEASDTFREWRPYTRRGGGGGSEGQRDTDMSCRLFQSIRRSWSDFDTTDRLRNLSRSCALAKPAESHPAPSRFTSGCFHTWPILALAWLHLFNCTI